MTVFLVGAGPGDPDLLTLKAARLLGQADVVVYDRLVGPDILAMIAPWAERIDVGKNPYGKRTNQTEINRILIDRGAQHETVVRLKGGDPFVFGRGGEEALDLEAAGIDVQVVPGITSSIAGPAAAGIPVTHRGVSSAFTVVTAHQDPTKPGSIDWEALARLNSTLVVLMGATRAARIRARLLSAGMDPTTPVAVVVEATTPRQRQFRLTLADLGDRPIPNPAVIVIGGVAAEPVIANETNPNLAAALHEHRALEGASSWH
ncbi:MAG: uroporphyrinogen-III C-methyltransferase [Acidimicrobiales bacterium]|nr:uroporphyrinogen-III C-methyltransferase [Acidimicrobiales bacterium]